MSSEMPAISILMSDFERAHCLSEALATHHVPACVVETSEALHQQLEDHRVDVLVIQQRLKGFLKGLDLVGKLQADLFHPAVVIVGDLTPVEKDSARRLGIRSIVEENADLAQLTAAVTSKLTQISTAQSLIPPRARRMAASAEVVRPLPHLLTKLCAYLHDETASLAELAQDISVDQRVTAELLKLTNSTAMGLSQKVASPQDAVKLLGVKRTIATVLATGILKVQDDLLRTLPPDVRNWYQTRTVMIASTAASFAERIERISGETAHVLGLFQDLGILVLANAEPRSYLQVLQRVRTIGQVRLEGIERDEFGMTHAEVSAAMLEKWCVPQSIAMMVLDHHPPEHRADHSDVEKRFLHVMRVAEAVANMGDVSSPHRQRLLASLLEKYGRDKTDECKTCIALGVNKTAESSKLFSVPPPDEAALRSLIEEVRAVERPLENVESIAPPAAEATATNELPRKPARSRAREAGRILVIDDEKSIVKMVQRLLGAAGFEVIACHCAEEAESRAAGVDLILCDVHLGGATGADVILRLRAAGVDAPVIMISGDRTRDTVVECIEAGVVDYVVKPFTRAVLIEKVTKHIQKAAPVEGMRSSV